MPWTVADVERHKKGLTAKQKRQWVAIANSALASCLAKGGNQRTCDASAIRQANGSVGTHEKIEITLNMKLYVNTTKDYTIRNTIHQERPYIIVPVVMMVEGVHEGSHGALYHSAAELGHVVEAWDGIPVVIFHPEDDGVKVSANDPLIIDQEVVGRVYNAHMDEGKLRAEVWIDEAKLSAQSSEALDAIREGSPLDVSVGVFTDEESIEGDWNGEHYVAIARNHRPDHLALLPGGEGACSWADGCGIRVNEDLNKKNINQKGGKNSMKENETKELSTLEVMKLISKDGFYAQEITVNLEYTELVNSARNLMDGMDTGEAVYFLHAMEEDSLVYEVRRRDGTRTLYRRTYQVKEDNVVELTGDPQRVKREVTYTTLSRKIKRTNFNNVNKKEVKMEKKEEQALCIDDKINALIANERSKFIEADREWLVAQDEAIIDKLTPEELKVEKVETPKITTEQAEKILKDAGKLKDTELSKEEQDQRDYGIKLYNEHKANMMKVIVENTPEKVWTEESLKEMSIETLSKLYESVKPETLVDHSLMSTRQVAKSGVAPLLPPGVKIIEEK